MGLFRCRCCGENGISLLGKILSRRGRNAVCKYCFAEYNFSVTSRVVVCVASGAFGTLLFYVLLFLVHLQPLFALLVLLIVPSVFAVLVLVALPLDAASPMDRNGR